MKSTIVTKHSEHKRVWYQIDASKFFLGRLATLIGRHLQGKNKVDFTPNADQGDFVVVINADKIQFSGRKMLQKKYYRFSGYPGGLRTKYLKDVFSENPAIVLKEAVRGMLPKNKFRKSYLSRLKIVTGKEHNFKIDISK